MCFGDGFSGETIPRIDAVKGLAAIGMLPMLGSFAATALEAEAENQDAPVTAFTGATAFLGDALTPVHGATIVVRGDRIVAAGPAASVSIPHGAKRINLAGKFIIPGLIDSHVHFFQSGGLFTRPDTVDLRAVRPYTEELAWIQNHLPDTFARYVRAGITSVSDVGGPFWNYEVRARAARTAVAPRIAAAGPLVSSVEREILNPHGDPPIVKITDPEVARRLVEREHASKTDFVKLWWVVDAQHPVPAFAPVASATMTRSKELNLRVAVHALELETARAAAQTGTDILVHSVFDKDVDDAFVALLKERNILYCPTLRVSGGYQTTFAMRPELSNYDLRYANPETTATLFMLQDIPGADKTERVARSKSVDPAAFRAAALRNLKRLHDAGITVAAGTDAGNIGTLHATSLYAEMVSMVEAGLSPHQVLVTGTLNGAKHMAREHELGTIAPGKLADLVVLDADPSADIRNTAHVHLTVKDGRAYDPHRLAVDTPEQTVQRVTNAVNAHNPAVLSDWITDATTRDRFAGLASAGAHVKVLSRQTRGSTVVQKEEISGIGAASGTAEITYHLRGGKIEGVRG